MEKKAKELRTGVRLNIRKPPKAEVPKNIYKRKEKHKKGYENEKSWPFLYFSASSCRSSYRCFYNSRNI